MLGSMNNTIQADPMFRDDFCITGLLKEEGGDGENLYTQYSAFGGPEAGGIYYATQ